ncbi:MAG TPA: DMT family transporter [Steroidobacteraceae bacterium]|nr:DMT family transporter [Steroidobacteraceae bacterium]
MTWRTWLAFGALGMVWGLPYFFIKLALVDLSAADVAWGRVSLGALVLLPIAWKRGALRSLAAHKGAVVAFAFAELIGPFFLISVGERWIGSSLAGILVATLPLTLILLSPAFGLREPLGTRRLVGLATGFIGVVVLLGIGSVHGLTAWAGVGCVLLATLGYAVGSIIVQKYLSNTDELGAVAMSLGIAAIVLLPGALWTAPSHTPALLSLLSVGVLGIVCTALALQLYFYLIRRAGAARASVITYINPAVAALLGVGVLHEPFGLAGGLGLALILLGSWLSTSRAPAILESELGPAR